MLISTADLSFTKAALENTETKQIAESKNAIYIVDNYEQLEAMEGVKIGDIAFVNESGVRTGVSRYYESEYMDNYGDMVTQKIWNPIVESLSEFTYFLGNVSGGIDGLVETSGIDDSTGFDRRSWNAKGKFLSAMVQTDNFGNHSAYNLSEMKNDKFTMGQITPKLLETEELGHQYETYGLKGNFVLKNGFEFTKDSFKATKAAGEIFSFETNQNFWFKATERMDFNAKVIAFTTPLFDLTNSPMKNARNEAGNMYYANGTGQADYRGITSNTNPININGQTALIAGGVRVRQNEASFYVGVHPTDGALRVVDYNGYNGGTFVYRPATASAWQIASSETYKENIEEYREEGIGILKKNKIYTYDYKEDANEKAKTKTNKKSKKIGVIAEQATEMLGEDEMSVDLYKMLSINWKASQEMIDKIESLEKQVESLRKGNSSK